MGKATDFRYNTGATRVPWAAVGENYNVHDLMEIIRFLMQGNGPEYDAALEAVWQQVKKLDELASPPGKLSLGSKVEAAEAACNEYLGIDSATFVSECIRRNSHCESSSSRENGAQLRCLIRAFQLACLLFFNLGIP